MKGAIDRIPCPHCGHVFDLEEAWDDADGRRFVELLTQLPAPVIRPLYNYLKLHRPKSRVLSWKRILTLTRELAPMIKDAQIRRDGIVYTIPAEHWAIVMDELARNPPKTLQLPLKGNGYLLEILASQADKQAAIQEQKTEQQRRDRGRTGAETGPKPVAAHLGVDHEVTEQKKSRPPAGWRGEV